MSRPPMGNFLNKGYVYWDLSPPRAYKSAQSIRNPSFPPSPHAPKTDSNTWPLTPGQDVTTPCDSTVAKTHRKRASTSRAPNQRERHTWAPDEACASLNATRAPEQREERGRTTHTTQA